MSGKVEEGEKMTELMGEKLKLFLRYGGFFRRDVFKIGKCVTNCNEVVGYCDRPRASVSPLHATSQLIRAAPTWPILLLIGRLGHLTSELAPVLVTNPREQRSKIYIRLVHIRKLIKSIFST